MWKITGKNQATYSGLSGLVLHVLDLKSLLNKLMAFRR